MSNSYFNTQLSTEDLITKTITERSNEGSKWSFDKGTLETENFGTIRFQGSFPSFLPSNLHSEMTGSLSQQEIEIKTEKTIELIQRVSAENPLKGIVLKKLKNLIPGFIKLLSPMKADSERELFVYGFFGLVTLTDDTLEKTRFLGDNFGNLNNVAEMIKNFTTMDSM